MKRSRSPVPLFIIAFIFLMLGQLVKSCGNIIKEEREYKIYRTYKLF